MSNDETGLTPPDLVADDFLRVPDEHFTADTVAIVTGGGSGIGQATSVALAINGLSVAAVDVDEDGLEAMVRCCRRDVVCRATADNENAVVGRDGDTTPAPLV